MQCAKERSIFKAIGIWSFYGTKHPGPETPVRPEEELLQLLPLIRFPVMDDADLNVSLQTPQPHVHVAFSSFPAAPHGTLALTVPLCQPYLGPEGQQQGEILRLALVCF